MTTATWGLFAATVVVTGLTPGPAVLFVVAQSLRAGPRQGVWAGVGILAGNAVYFALSAAGLGAVLLAAPGVFRAGRVAGAAYLVYLGARLIVGAGNGAGGGPAPPDRAGRVVRRGFVLQAGNPKALVFFAALLPQFVDPAGDVPAQVAVLAATSIGSEFVILAGYAVAAGRLSAWAARPAVGKWLDRATGGLLVAAGAAVGVAAA